MSHLIVMQNVAALGISEVHLRDKLRITQEEAIREQLKEYAKSHGLKMFYHEDGSRAEPKFMEKMCTCFFSEAYYLV